MWVYLFDFTIASFTHCLMFVFGLQAPGMKYAYGFNSDMGDKGLITNNKLKNWDNV